MAKASGIMALFEKKKVAMAGRVPVNIHRRRGAARSASGLSSRTTKLAT